MAFQNNGKMRVAVKNNQPIFAIRGIVGDAVPLRRSGKLAQ